MTTTEKSTAVIAKRVDTGSAETDEIEHLVESAGYQIGAVLTQTRESDPAYQIGEGKVSEVSAAVRRTDASVVIFDNELGPYQTFNLGQRLPDGVEVKDRFKLILDIFGQRAQTRKAQLQVELAELRYELPRAEAKVSLAKRDERPGFMGLGEYDESREEDIKSRISRIREELSQIEKTEEHRRDQRRESGFDLVAMAGYTNAGKSTLMQALAEDIEIGENEERHPDLETTAEAQDNLFTTLGTTTRRLGMNRRDVLLTDTVGFISDLPHWLVESFKSTLESVYQADLVLLVVDVSEPVDEIRDKLSTCHDTLYERNEAPIITVLNKIDKVSDDELVEKQEKLAALAPNPVPVSALEKINLDLLQERIDRGLPPLEHERLVIPMTDETMSIISWVHDNAYVENVSYEDEQVVVEFEAKKSVIEKTHAKVQSLPAV
ncbi:MAG: GTPase HflX [Halobacteriaceae archaeon]